MNIVINKDIIPDLTYAKTHIAPFQSIGIGLAIFCSDFSCENYCFFNDIRKKPIQYKPGD